MDGFRDEAHNLSTCNHRNRKGIIMTSVRLDEETEARLDRLAAHTNRSKAFYLRELVESGLPRLEHEYGIAQLAENIRAGREETISHEEMKRDLGLND